MHSQNLCMRKHPLQRVNAHFTRLRKRFVQGVLPLGTMHNQAKNARKTVQKGDLFLQLCTQNDKKPHSAVFDASVVLG